MKLRRLLTLFAAVVVTTSFVQAQQPTSEAAQNTQPIFKEHRIGESAQQFFSIAKMGEKNGMLSTDYCRAYLSDPKVKKTVEKAKKRSGDDSSMWDNPSSLVATMIWDGCNNVQAALAGHNVEVDLRFAAEFGNGSAKFVAGHLASMNFSVKARLNDVVDDMSAKLNAKPQLGVDTVQNSVGAIVKQRRAIWTLPDTFVTLTELHSLEGNDVGTEVSVSDPAIMKHRRNSLD